MMKLCLPNNMCSLYRCVFLIVTTAFSLVNCNNGPQVINTATAIIKREDTPIGTIIGNITAKDDDGPQELQFSISDEGPDVTSQLVELVNPRGDSVTGRTVDIKLIANLDRDFMKSSRYLNFRIEDNPGGTGNTIKQEITLYITDVNDVAPSFELPRYEKQVPENAVLNSPVTTVKATDPDSGAGGIMKYTMEPVGQAASDDYKNAFILDEISGEVGVNRPLDASVYNYYEYTLFATDGGGLQGQSVLLIKITDIQDKPPYFTNLPYSVTIKENIAVSSKVLQVTALDGDKGVPNNVTYSFISGETANFDLNESTGWITVNSSLDRDAPEVRQRGGVYAIIVRAKEIDSTQDESHITATTLVTVTVEDVNDNVPTFNSDTYQASILENMQEGVPITFDGPGAITFMNASDIDQSSSSSGPRIGGSRIQSPATAIRISLVLVLPRKTSRAFVGENSHFTLSLLKDGQPYTDFAPLPGEIFSESSILIRVNNQTALDYEKITTVTFQIIAREKNTPEMKSSISTVTVNIKDMNDNSPVFQPAVYPTLNISEDAGKGTEVVVLTASDLDRGDFGKITYHIRGSNNLFQIDETTGRITLAGALDRETVDNYFITAEARDGGGLTTFVNLDILVTDVNDKWPVFRRDEYYASVREDKLLFYRGVLVVEATDDDEPNTPNSLVMYRIVKASDGLQNKFFVNQSSGVITLVDEIDYEALPASLGGRVLLEVEAYDQGNPSLSTTINITVEIEDFNDNAPKFDTKVYTARIIESTLAGTSVVTVTATDDDSSKPNNEFLYRIDSGAGDKFRINFQSGEITVEVGAKLDREDKYFYSLNVSATDRGATSKTGICVVEITITDANDEPPTFNSSVFTQSVRENANSDKQVVCATASDPDENPLLFFSVIPDSVQGFNEEGKTVTSMEVKNYFDINNSSGCISVSSPLDRETAEMVVMEVIVEDLHAALGSKTQTATATVTITILDYNDNEPEFLPNATYKLRISEGLEVNSAVLRLETVDKDKDQTVTYFIKTDPDNNFRVEPSTGIMRLRKQLDRETKPTVSVTVVAKDDGTPVKSSTATVSISVQDVNDNYPVFKPYLTEYTVPENAAVNTTVATISATDVDQGEFARIIYTFDVSESDNKLKIDRKTGKISVARTLDRETRSSYTLFVTAIDNPNFPNNQRTNQTKAIIISVEDVNDNDPVFTNLDANTQPSVLENADIGRLVFTVTAEDQDTGDNARLQYALVANKSIGELFKMTTVKRVIGGIPKYFGDIEVDGSLLGTVGEISVNITATDSGNPARSAEASLVIVVEDVNLHQPVFVHPSPPRPTITTKEEEVPNSLIITLLATDEDHGKNAEIEYTIEQENDFEKFLLDPITGDLRNRIILDRETQGSFLLKIKAEDKGKPTPRFSILTLTIVLLDVNDQLPVFTRTSEPMYIKIQEERVLDQTTTNLDIATDADSGNNSIICYYIIGGDPQVSTHFSLKENGILTLTKALDRESLADPFINMIVWATPKCYENISINTRPAVFPPTDYNRNFTLLWVKVNITDINDNPPEFKQSVLTLGVTRDTGYGVSILNLQDLITDKDATMKVEFQALRTEQYLQKKVTGEPFKVFKNGSVVTNTYFQSDMYGYFRILIQAEEKVEGGDPFVTNATLRISLINDDQRVKVVFKNTPGAVRSFQVTFTQRLQNTTGYRVVVDKIQTHENKYGQPEVNKTDMFIHGEDLKTNETISASELLRVIDMYAEALLGLRFEYKVLEIVPTVVAAEEKDLENVYKMALILVTIILALLCVAIAIVFYVSRQQYKRKLKAATAMAYATSDSDYSPGDQQGHTITRVQGKLWRQMYNGDLNGGSNTDLQKLEMPGTNVHAYENVNPIYLEKVLLEETGEQADDDSLDNNAVDTTKPSQFGEQQLSMNFYHEDNNLNKVPQSKLGSGDAILNAALQQHEANKAKYGIHQNGALEIKQDNFTGLPTTEI